MRPALVIVALLALVFGVAYARSASAVVDNSAPEDAATNDIPAADPIDTAAQAINEADPFTTMDANTIAADQSDTNCDAFLQMISVSEGTATAADPYAVCFGYRHTVQDFSRHPAEWYTDASGARVREWGGESLANLGPSYAGKVSTAAGRYQIIRPTWEAAKAALSLPDFGPDSQDKAALWIVRQAGQLDAVKAGRFDTAVAGCAKQWASLPGANAPGQGMRRLDDLRVAYTEAGGVLA